MKNLFKPLIPAILLSLIFTSCRSSEPISCNQNIPGWGESLGTVSFYTSTIWTIDTLGIFQIWSDAVTATNCQKTTFNGGDPYTYNRNADCRSNPGFPGDLFSWCAVIRFADELCPYPWRVPTRQDFINLDIAFGGTGNNRDIDIIRDTIIVGTDTTINISTFVDANYIYRWGGSFSGSCGPSGNMGYQGSWGSYWTQTELNEDDGFRLGFNRSGRINPQLPGRKFNGFSLRCVRDVP